MFRSKLKKYYSRRLAVKADTLTPISAFRALCDEGNCFLLESMEENGRAGRYTVLGLDPLLFFTHEDGKSTITGSLAVEPLLLTGDLFEHLRSLINYYNNGQSEIFTDGFLTGYLGFETFRYIEPGVAMNNHKAQLPDSMFMFPGVVLRFDNYNQTLSLIVHMPEEDGDEEKAKSKLEKLLQKLVFAKPEIVQPGEDHFINEKLIVNEFKTGDFLKSVESAKKLIRAGDIFQVVLSRRRSIPRAVDPLETYRTMRVINPSPYMYLLEFDNLSILGASPETMVKSENGKILMRPIAGTRQRGKTPREEEQLTADLLNDEKELAEHDMLVDLSRNDIGRVAEIGTVNVTGYRKIGYFSHVMHIVTTVTGVRRKGKDNIDVFKACFPAGTVTGAPKIRAIEIIDKIEPYSRGPYAGAIGYFDFADRMDTCIAIRTLIVEKGKTWWQAGAGIVADSKAYLEYLETENKGRIFIKTLTNSGE